MSRQRGYFTGYCQIAKGASPGEKCKSAPRLFCPDKHILGNLNFFRNLDRRAGGRSVGRKLAAVVSFESRNV